jgi:chaperonin GroEL (HSP60 family)
MHEMIVYAYAFENLGFLLDKKVGVNQPKRIENARILIANTPMDADKVKVDACVCLYSQLTLISDENDL